MDLHLNLVDDGERTPLRVRLERALREAIREGRLAPGARLPSTRALCAELGVSRGVVVDAYAQLAAEGYLQTRRGGGTRVAETLLVESTPVVLRARGAAVRYDMNPFRPALSGFPRGAWMGALARVLRSAPDERLGYPDPSGVPELRTTLAAYLGRVRGVRSTPERILVTGGMRQGMDLLWGALSQRGARRVGVEQPGWAGMRETALEAGLQVIPLAVDEHGLTVDRLEDARLDAVALAPAHQYPTGAVLAPERRTALIAWARRRGALIVEDDYDAEYRYDRHPVGSLQGLAPEQVVYGGSTSKTLAPAVRVGWLVLPERLCEPVAQRQRRRGASPSPLQQLALADLMERGELDRHLRRQRRLYSGRRAALLQALGQRLPELTVSGAAAGLYVVLSLPLRSSEQAVLCAARARGIALEGRGGESPGLVLGYANLPDAAVGAAVETLAQALGSALEQSALEQSVLEQSALTPVSAGRVEPGATSPG